MKSGAALAPETGGERCKRGANSSPVTGDAEPASAVGTNSTLEQAVPYERRSSMVITELGYLLLALSVLAVLLFCWLTSASVSSLRRDK